MNAERLLAHYERIADAPDAVARLRRFILDLAVRGKLVPQDPKDEPASELLKRVGKKTSPTLRRSKNDNASNSVLPPYSLPASWRWARIGDHLELINGMAFKPTDWVSSGIPIVRIQNLNRLDAPFNYCDPERARDRVIIDDGAFLISWSGTPGTSFGAFIWDRGRAILNQHIFRCEFRQEAFEASYLRLAINGRLEEMISKAHGGVGLQHITKGELESLLIALPPTAEQHLIVAKVDELMALCDRLEAARAEREKKRDRLTVASLARLNEPDPDTFTDDAQFALNVLPALTTRLDQIKQIRQTILNLAVRGKLVPQDPKDEPASELLKRIAKARGCPGGLVRVKSQRPPSNEGTNVALPKGWASARLADLVAVLNGRAYKQHELLSRGTPVLRVGNLFTSDRWYYSDLELDDRKYCNNGDLIFAWSASFGPFIWQGGRVIYHYHIWKLPLYSETELDKLFLYNFLLQKTREIKEAGHGISMIHMTKEKMEQIEVPLPPLPEQHRIVAKVDKLMGVCDRLEASLAAGEDARSRLLDALLAEALEPAARKLEAA